MPRTIRYLESGTIYEICFRAQSCLPFVAYQCLNYAIQCVLARVQRDNKVILCHDIWNGSHPHILVVSKDSAKLVDFQMEIKKKITEIWKRLLGLQHLRIWEENTAIIKVGDLEAAIERIVYLYANPAQDNLEVNIESFPGASSWFQFQESLGELNAETCERFPWIKLRTIPRLSDRRISPAEDREVMEAFKTNKYWHPLRRYPNAWMKCFGIRSDIEARALNEEIIKCLREKERSAAKTRREKNLEVFGAEKLGTQEILKWHQPKKRERKVFIITSDKEIRMTHIERVHGLQVFSKGCYEQWRSGNLSINWPAEIYRPRTPPILNVLAP